MPTRPDGASNPPGVMEALRQKAIVVGTASGDRRRKMQQAFNEIFRPR